MMIVEEEKRQGFFSFSFFFSFLLSAERKNKGWLEKRGGFLNFFYVHAYCYMRVFGCLYWAIFENL